MHNNDKFYIGFSNLLNISPYFKKNLFEFFDFDIERAFNAKEEDLEKLSFENPELKIPRNFLKQRNEINLDYEFEKILEKGVKYITFEDNDYSKLLKNTEDYPLLLYYKGDFERHNFENTLAIVGSRRASSNGKQALLNILSQMKNLPLTIVSGLAEGIDTTAHKGAILNGLNTLAVIGCGFDYVYPSSNRDLYRQIEENYGIIFSEYPPNTAPQPQNFPQRNRIITGLSYGTLVAEAALKSGAMISARLTLEQNRELMCMPGLISNPNTEGIYKLVKQGAPIVTNVSDIFDILNWSFEAHKKEKIELNETEKNVFDIIALEPLNFEKIQAKIPYIDVSSLMVTLTNLELKGIIKQTDGIYLMV